MCLALLLSVAFSMWAQDGAGETVGTASVPIQEEEPVVEEQPRIDEFRSVIGLEQWRYEYDISDYQPGKYNLIIEGRDHAGNVYTEGPYNIVIDPNSDLPIANISNPTPNMRVGGNLNILGTCVDDDAVSLVEISINEGPFQKASGTEFWSFELSTSDLLDGAYSITARGTDINGVVGNETSVVFNLDRQKPVIEITSHENGDLVNGRIDLSGTVSDLNGIAKLRMSSDNGETYQNQEFKGDKDAQTVDFTVKIDTGELEDGAQIYWFEGTDRTGSVYQSAFLLFVDNQAPEITIMYPTEEHSVNGVFSVSGRVTDEVGIESLSWRIGKGEPTDIPLRPGDPYWVQEFDFTGQESAEIIFSLLDKTGNVTEQELELELSAEEDIPRVEIVYPQDQGRTERDRLAGFLRDDDGIAGIAYRLDDGPEQTRDTGQSFDIVLPELSAGEHTIELQAIDVNGLRSDVQTITFTKIFGPPVISLVDLVTEDEETLSFSNGMEIRTNVHESIQGTIDFKNPVGTASYAIAGEDEAPLELDKTGVGTTMSFSIPIPKDTIPYGFVDLLIKVQDEYDIAAEKHFYFFVRNLTSNQESHGLYFSNVRSGPGNPLPLSREEPFIGRYVGYPVESVVLDPESELISVRENRGEVEIIAVGQGVTSPTTVRVTSNRGTVFTAGPFVFTTDTTAPRIELDASVKSERVGNTLRLLGSVSDNVGGVSLSYKLGDQEFQIPVSGSGQTATFERTVQLGSQPETGVVLSVKATDLAGNGTVVYRTLNRTPRYVADPESTKDPTPTVAITYPLSGQVILDGELTGDSTYIGGVVSGVAGVSELYYSLDRGEERSFAPTDTFELTFPDLAPGQHSILVRAVSDKGVSGQSARVTFSIGTPPPNIKLDGAGTSENMVKFVPGMDISVESESRLFGSVTGNVASLVSVIDGGEETPLRVTTSEDGAATFAVPIGSTTGFRRHDVEVRVTDSHGATDAIKTFYYRTEPRGNREVRDTEGFYFADSRFPSNDEIILPEGASIPVHYHGRPISEISIAPEGELFSLKGGGNLYTLVAETAGISNEVVITAITVDGDTYSTPPVSIIIDREAPTINLQQNLTGQWVRDSVLLSGSVTDNLRLSEILVLINGKEVLRPEIPGGNDLTLPGLTEIPFELELPLENISDGNLTLTLVASDSAENEIRRELLVRKDATPPTAIQIGPLPETPVNGRFRFSARAIDDGNIDYVEYSEDGYGFDEIEGTSVFHGDMYITRFMVMIANQVFRITDQAGNQTLFVPDLNLDPESDMPEVQVQIPQDGALIRNDFTISGMVFDDDGVDKIFYRVDGGEFLPLEGANNFEIDLKLEDLDDNRHTVEVRAEDIVGVEGEIVEMWFNVSKSEPRSALLEPAISETVKGIVDLKGQSIDENGIDSVFVSFDNGNTFNRADGAGDWTYSLDTRTLPDGTYSLLIRAVDSFGVQGLYTTLLNIDNTKPNLELTGFLDREPFADVLNVRGRISDTIGIDSVHIDILPVIGDEHGPQEMAAAAPESESVVDDTAEVATAASAEGEESSDQAAETAGGEESATEETADASAGEETSETADAEATEPPDGQETTVATGDSSETGTDAESEPESGTSEVRPYLSFEVPPDEVLLRTIDLSSLPPGVYNLQITARDRAQNTGYISRNFEKIKTVQFSNIEILFPAQGEHLFGEFTLQGHIDTPVPPERAGLFIDGELFEALEVTPYGYYSVTIVPERLTDGFHVLQVEAKLADGEVIRTEERTIEYSKTGPWVIIDNFRAGDFASQRPWVLGRAGYTTDIVPADADEEKALLRSLEVTRVDISLDNGKTFQQAKGEEEWQFRLETQNIQDGVLNMMVRARFRDGSTAVAKTQLIVDDTPPNVTMLSPEEGMSFNDTISLSGTAFDANGLQDVSVALRRGDKAQYEVPTFIQGLFLDVHLLGSTTWEVGAGLTFFDDNVKLSFFVGTSPPGRFTGVIMGAKLLANIAVLPYGFFFGPDWNWLSSSLAVGADFTFFNMAEEGQTETTGLVLGAVIGQIELARIEVQKWKIFNAFSFYIEGQVWFISSDIEGGIAPKLAFGVRSEVF